MIFHRQHRGIFIGLFLFMAIAIGWTLSLLNAVHSVLCLGVVVIIVVIIKPIFGIVLIGFLYPLSFISTMNIGYKYFMTSFRIVIFVSFCVCFSRALISRRKIDFSNVRMYLVLILLGAMLTTISHNEIAMFQKIQNITFLKQLGYVILFVTIYNLVNAKNDIKVLLYPFLLSLSILSVLAYLQYFLDIEIIYKYDASLAGYSPSFRIFFGEDSNPNPIMNLYLVAIPFIFYHVMNENTMFNKSIGFLMLMLLCGVVILSQSRSAIFALPFAIFIVQIVQKKVTFRQVVTYIFVAATIYAIVIGVSDYIVNDRFYLNDILADRGIGGRLNQYKASIWLLIDHPFGVGSKSSKLIGQYGGTPHSSMHNMFLQAYATAGLIGFVGYTGLIFTVIILLVKSNKWSRNEMSDRIQSPLLAAIIGYVFHNQFHYCTWEYSLWIFLALSLVCYRETKKEYDLWIEKELKVGKNER